MKFLTRRLIQLTPDEIDTLLKADDIMSTIKSRMTSDRLGRNYDSVSMKLYFNYYDEDITIPYDEIADIDRILDAMANCNEIITEVNNEGNEDGQ